MSKLYFGKYKHIDSPLHNLHPLPKFLITIASILYAGFDISLQKLSILVAVFVFMLIISRISVKQIYNIFKPFRFLLIFTFLIQLFFNDNFSYTNMNYYSAVTTTSRFILMIAFSALFTATTKPLDIVKIMHKLLKPLRFFRVNTEDITASGVIALRFIPLLFEEADKIKTAQILRNQEKSSGIRRLFNIESFIVPLFIRVIHFSEQIAVTLQFRKNWDNVCKMKKMTNREIVLIPFYIIFLTVAFYV